MIILGGQWRGASTSQVWKLPAGAWGPPVAHVDCELLYLGMKPEDECSAPKQGLGLSLLEWGARLCRSCVAVPACRAGVSPAWWQMMFPIPSPSQELRTCVGLASLRMVPGCLVTAWCWLCRAEGNLFLSRSPQHEAGPFPLPTTEWLILPLSGGLITSEIEALFPRPSRGQIRLFGNFRG